MRRPALRMSSTLQPQKSKPRLFRFWDLASLVELAQGESHIATFLRRFPDWLLRAADRWAEQDYDQEKERKAPWQHRLVPMPDPWQYLLDAPGVTPLAKQVCRAAQSWLFGFSRLCRMAEGFATQNTDWFEKAARAKAAGDTREHHRIIMKLANKFVLSRATQDDVNAQRDPLLLLEMERLLKVRHAQIVHRPHTGRWKAQDFNPITDPTEIKAMYPFEYLLVQNWLCFPNCKLPGLMFWSNGAITKWWFAKARQDPKKSRGNFGRDRVKKMRQRLGLAPVSEKSPWVRDVTTEWLANGDLKITLLDRKGKQLFQGTFQRCS